MQEIPVIVLTGTIIPNAFMGGVLPVDERRNDYLKAIRYYTRFGKVIFIENSDYDFRKDEEFRKISNLEIMQFPKSKYYERGKGFQEFELLDRFVSAVQDKYTSFIKITGRYIISDFDSLYRDCQSADVPFIIDTSYKHKHALTYMFYSDIEFYKRNLMNLYKQCDDHSPIGSIEDVMYRFLHSNKDMEQKYRFFLTAYNIIGRAGSNGMGLINRPRWKVWRRTMFSRKFRYFCLGKRELRGV